MTRIGKIARLPSTVRAALNQRLANGEMGLRLVAWLNTLPEVQSVLAADFEGRAITKQNLSEWRLGGFADWQRHEAAREWTGEVMEESRGRKAEPGRLNLTDRMAAPVLMEVMKVLQQSTTSEATVAQIKAVLSVAGQFTQLRRADHQIERTRLEQERLAMKMREKQSRSARLDGVADGQTQDGPPSLCDLVRVNPTTSSKAPTGMIPRAERAGEMIDGPASDTAAGPATSAQNRE